MRSVYLDYNATTPLDPAVREAMLPLLGEDFGNPSSIHHLGRRARVAVDNARETVAAVWRCKPSEVVFTSGGTESNNLAILGTARRLRDRGRHIVSSTIEHASVLAACRCLEREGFRVTYVPVNCEGLVDPDMVCRALARDTILVSVMAVNNEVGAIQPVATIGRRCRDAGVVFHTDAAHWFGKLPLESIADFNADLVTFCAHKLHGPKGAGALYCQSGCHPSPLVLGGAQENEHRSGTENVAALVGLANTVKRFLAPPVFVEEDLRPLTTKLRSLTSIPGVFALATKAPSVANTVSFLVDDCDSLSLLAALDLEGVCASAGSACSAGSLAPSHVVQAMGYSEAQAGTMIRFSLGRESVASEIDRVRAIFPEIVRRIRDSR